MEVSQLLRCYIHRRGLEMAPFVLGEALELSHFHYISTILVLLDYNSYHP
jgi:hypothetical protein